MEGISKDGLINIADQLCANERLIIYDRIVAECHELQEPWMTLDEFLKSGFEGECWIIYCGDVEKAYFFINSFYKRVDSAWSFHKKQITHVMPIHKPEPPR